MCHDIIRRLLSIIIGCGSRGCRGRLCNKHGIGLELLVVAVDYLFEGGAHKLVLPIVVKLDHALEYIRVDPEVPPCSMKLPAPEKTDSTLAEAEFLHPTSAK